MYSLRSLYRTMLLVWLALVLCMAFIVARNAGEEGSGSLFAFLFSGSPAPVPLPPVALQEMPAPAPTPAITPEAVVEQAKPQSQWIALQKGKKAGEGPLGRPEITTLDNGDVEVRFTCEAPGNFREYHPARIDALCIDVMGPWGKGMKMDTRPDRGVLKRVQVADHKQWVRVSGIARESTDRLEARVEYDATHKILRVVFSRTHQ